MPGKGKDRIHLSSGNLIEGFIVRSQGNELVLAVSHGCIGVEDAYSYQAQEGGAFTKVRIGNLIVIPLPSIDYIVQAGVEARHG